MNLETMPLKQPVRNTVIDHILNFKERWNMICLVARPMRYKADYRRQGGWSDSAAFREDLVQLMLHKCPSAAMVRNQKGKLALHNAIGTHKNWEGIMKLPC